MPKTIGAKIEEDKKNMNLFGAQVKIIDFGFAIRLDPKKKIWLLVL